MNCNRIKFLPETENDITPQWIVENKIIICKTSFCGKVNTIY